jgi:metal-responsive CopG/Arc/MetJ family transcriptional regulator
MKAAVVIAASVPSDLVEQLDKLVAARNGWNRSKAITEAIRGLLDAKHGR